MTQRRVKIDNLRKRLIRDEREAILVSTQTNQRYLSGFDFCDGYVLILAKKAYLLADFRYIEAARAEVSSEDFEVVMPNGSMLSGLGAIAEDEGITLIYLEDDSVSCAMLEKLRKNIHSVEFAGGASAAILSERAVKSDWELRKIAEAQKITDKAFEHILGYITPKVTERDIALELEFFMRRNGAEAEAFGTIAVSGSASSMPHGASRNIPIERGFLTMDFGARVDGYNSDMTRTVVIGGADEEMKHLYDTVLRAQRAALEVICEGAECREIDAVARNIINSAGYEGCFGHSLGHGVGMFVHEEPRLAPSAPAGKLLERGNVVTVEPGIYLSGKYGCRIEDMVAIAEDGKVINFTRSDKEMIVI